MIYDCTQLNTELLAAGLRIRGCASTGRIDWTDTPTPAEQATAAAVLAAHDPTKREREQEAEKKAIQEPLQEILAATQNSSRWMSLTAAQRWDLVRRALYVLALYLRKAT